MARRFLLRCVFALLLAGIAGHADGTHDCLNADPFADPVTTARTCQTAAASEADPVQRAALLENLGVAERELGHLEDSKAALILALSLDAGNPSIMHQLGWTHRQSGDYPAAERLLRRAADLHAFGQVSLALCVVLQDQGKFADSVAPCQQALADAGPNQDTSFFTALAYNQTGQAADAWETASQGMALSDPGARMYEEAARAAWTLGNHPAAREAVERGLQRYPLNLLLVQRMLHFPMFDD